MGLVDYSDSEGSASESEAAPTTTSKAPTPAPKKPFQRAVDRSSSGKIIVNLGQPAAKADTGDDQPEPPPAKRARTAGGGRFSGFNSFLPPPKNPKATPSSASTSNEATSRPGVNLKTSAAPGFSRDAGDEVDAAPGEPGPAEDNSTAQVPAPAPSIPQGQKAAHDVKMTGKPLMFKPLSVSRKPNKKKTPKVSAAPASQPSPRAEPATAQPVDPTPAPPPKKTSLFSLPTATTSRPSEPPSANYEPMFSADDTYNNHTEDGVTGDYASHVPPSDMPSTTKLASQSLGDVVDTMNLSAADRRQLFGRERAPKAGAAASRVVNFNMDTEYAHNEQLRASGEQQQAHNPVRAIMGGKHNMAQLLRNVNDQREALEDSFAKGKTNRKEASSKYGW